MRNLTRQKQKMWFCSFKEDSTGIDTEKVYSKPERHNFSVSATSGYVNGWGAGFQVSYDRYITSYERNYIPKEGTMVFIDIEPVLDEFGNLAKHIVEKFDSEGNPLKDVDGNPIIQEEYVTEPDYMVHKILNTKRGGVARYGIKKV